MQAETTGEKAHSAESSGDSAEVGRFRDDFYRDGFRVVLLSLGMVVGSIALLIVLSLYFFLHQVLPISFAVYEDWRVQADVPLDKPYLRLPDLLQWVSTTLPAVMSLDFINYDKNINDATSYFTSNGWPKYLAMVNNYLGHDEVLKKKEFINSNPSGAPVVLNQGLIDGKYSWWVQMPMDVRYSDVGGNNNVQPVIIQILITRISTLNNLNGVAIENLIANKG